MDNKYYTNLLKSQIEKFSDENRFIEFKSNHQEADRIGRYISALSNGACLANEEYGYLYFGVDDTTHEVRKTTFDPAHTKVGAQDLELYLRQYISPKINFVIDEFLYEERERVVVVIIPAATGEPTIWMGKPYIRVNSQTTELTPYTDWIRTIYNSRTDWSKEICPEATLDDVDPAALLKAKEGFKQRYPKKAAEVDSWSDSVFLDKAKLTINGQITRTTLLLVGKEEAAHHLNHIAQIVWRLQTDEETAGDIYSIPFLLSASELYNRIRNYRIKIYPRNSLIPADVWKYDEESILEALYNCIAHQDYLRNGRIIVTEKKDELVFSNQGSFYEGTFSEYLEGQKTPENYRNPFLVRAMVNVKMIDTQGYGIHKIFQSQKERFLPMPSFENEDREKVVLHIPGNVINKDYSLLLMENADMSLTDAYLLDRVQRGLDISDEAINHLRKQHLVEGHKKSLIVSRRIAEATGHEVEYSLAKGLDEKYYKDLLLNALSTHNRLSRKQIDQLLIAKLPDSLSDKQKKAKVGNILTALRKKGCIVPEGKHAWIFVSKF